MKKCYEARLLVCKQFLRNDSDVEIYGIVQDGEGFSLVSRIRV